MLSEADRLEIHNLLIRAFWLVDHGRAAEVADCFVGDGQWTFGPGTPKPGTIAGDEIRAFLKVRQAQAHIVTRHALSNILIEEVAPGEANVFSLLTLFRSENEGRSAVPSALADIQDVVKRGPDGWKLAQRTVLPIFHG